MFRSISLEEEGEEEDDHTTMEPPLKKVHYDTPVHCFLCSTQISCQQDIIRQYNILDDVIKKTEGDPEKKIAYTMCMYTRKPVCDECLLHDDTTVIHCTHCTERVLLRDNSLPEDRTDKSEIKKLMVKYHESSDMDCLEVFDNYRFFKWVEHLRPLTHQEKIERYLSLSPICIAKSATIRIRFVVNGRALNEILNVNVAVALAAFGVQMNNEITWQKLLQGHLGPYTISFEIPTGYGYYREMIDLCARYIDGVQDYIYYNTYNPRFYYSMVDMWFLMYMWQFCSLDITEEMVDYARDTFRYHDGSNNNCYWDLWRMLTETDNPYNDPVFSLNVTQFQITKENRVYNLMNSLVDNQIPHFDIHYKIYALCRMFESGALDLLPGWLTPMVTLKRLLNTNDTLLWNPDRVREVSGMPLVKLPHLWYEGGPFEGVFHHFPLERILSEKPADEQHINIMKLSCRTYSGIIEWNNYLAKHDAIPWSVLIDKVLPKFPNTVFIAGGSVLECLMNTGDISLLPVGVQGTTFPDLDVFFLGSENDDVDSDQRFLKFLDTLVTEMKKDGHRLFFRFTSRNVLTIMCQGVPMAVQLIYSSDRFLSSFDVVDSFDFHICQFAYSHGDSFQGTPRALADLASLTFTTNDHRSHPVLPSYSLSVCRVHKYLSKGFGMRTGYPLKRERYFEIHDGQVLTYEEYFHDRLESKDVSYLTDPRKVSDRRPLEWERSRKWVSEMMGKYFVRQDSCVMPSNRTLQEMASKLDNMNALLLVCPVEWENEKQVAEYFRVTAVDGYEEQKVVEFLKNHYIKPVLFHERFQDLERLYQEHNDPSDGPYNLRYAIRGALVVDYPELEKLMNDPQNKRYQYPLVFKFWNATVVHFDLLNSPDNDKRKLVIRFTPLDYLRFLHAHNMVFAVHEKMSSENPLDRMVQLPYYGSQEGMTFQFKMPENPETRGNVRSLGQTIHEDSKEELFKPSTFTGQQRRLPALRIPPDLIVADHCEITVSGTLSISLAAEDPEWQLRGNLLIYTRLK